MNPLDREDVQIGHWGSTEARSWVYEMAEDNPLKTYWEPEPQTANLEMMTWDVKMNSVGSNGDQPPKSPRPYT